MASLRGTVRVFRAFRPTLNGQRRHISSKASSAKRSLAPLCMGALTAGVGAYGWYKLSADDRENVLEKVKSLTPAVQAADQPKAQPSVFSQGKNNAVYLWITLKPSANAQEVAKIVAKLQKYVDEVTDPTMKDEDDEILAGVGFGPNFYRQVGGKTLKDFTYAHRKGTLGDMPSSGGDVFIHAKCNTQSKLYELVQLIMRKIPKDSVQNAEDVYSFVYKNGRDLSGFIDGTENAADEDSRQNIAVEKETGGSYVITQKWIHQFDVIHSEKEMRNHEKWVGRTKPDSTELSRKTITSHVARMTSGNSYNAKKPFEIVRQSMPYGSVCGDSGLFFIGYSASPENLNYMLDRMVGAGGDGHSDDIMRLTQNVKGTYWYFPGEEEMKKLA